MSLLHRRLLWTFYTDLSSHRADNYAASTRPTNRHDHRPRPHPTHFYGLLHHHRPRLHAHRGKRTLHRHDHRRHILRPTTTDYDSLTAGRHNAFYRVVYDHHTTNGPRSEPATPDITTTHCLSSDHRAPTALLPHRPRPTGRHRLAFGASQRTLSRPLTPFHWTYIRTAPTPSGSSSTLTPSSSTSGLRTSRLHGTPTTDQRACDATRQGA